MSAGQWGQVLVVALLVGGLLSWINRRWDAMDEEDDEINWS